MKVGWMAVCAAVVLSAVPARADTVLGFIGTESGVPIAGQEDIVIYDLTGPVFGCSTAAGSPICTAVGFNDVVVRVNGAINVNLGDIGPGVTESFAFPAGTFGDGTITSLSLTATLSETTVVDDLANTFVLDPAVSISLIATDGSLTPITGAPAVVAAPEPSAPVLATLGCLLLWASSCVKRARRSAATPQI